MRPYGLEIKCLNSIALLGHRFYLYKRANLAEIMKTVNENSINIKPPLFNHFLEQAHYILLLLKYND